MIDTRALQRTLFRMQLDANFAARIFAREAASIASTDLCAQDLEWILMADPVAISADPGGRRLSQLLGNVVGEFTSVVHLAVERCEMNDILLGFARSPEFHAAIRFDDPLPMAFANCIDRRLGDIDDEVVRAIFLLERTMVSARRSLRESPEPQRGAVVLAPKARLLDLPQGTLELHERLSAESQSGDAAQISLGPGRETLLLSSNQAARLGGHYPVAVEVLSEAVAGVLRAAETPLDQAAQQSLAQSRGVDLAELQEFLSSLVAEGVLQNGEKAG